MVTEDETPLCPAEVVIGFDELIRRDASEEEVHQFLKSNSLILECLRNRWAGVSSVTATLSKFPVAVDRIPDFTLVNITGSANLPGVITFVELKKPGARLYVEHGRMSKELNDAWMESIDNIRLVIPIYEDFIRRLVKHLKGTATPRFWGSPVIESVIIIGRRATLKEEDVSRLHGLISCTNRIVTIITYDSLLDIFRKYTKEKESK